MKTFIQFITEKVLSIGFNPKHEHYREKHRQELHDLLHNSYKKAGGYKGHPSGSKEESNDIHNDITNSHIKAVRRNNKLTAAMLYKSSHGRKRIAGGTNGTIQGKTDLLKTTLDDHTKKRAWGEVSGAPEHIQRKMGVPVIHNQHAKKLVGKSDIDLDPNGEHYTRQIGPERHKKVLMGHPKED